MLSAVREAINNIFNFIASFKDNVSQCCGSVSVLGPDPGAGVQK